MSDRDMIDERELQELFAPRRPDADAFAQGVAARIHRAQQPPAEPTAMHRVAAWAPFPLSGPKLLMWLSMPVLLLAGSWLAMVGSARSIRHALDHQGPGRDSHTLLRHPLLRHAFALPLQMVVLLASIVFSMFGWPYLFDGIIAMILVSMLALSVVVRLQARAGIADRPTVAILCVGLLEILLTMTVVFSLFELAGVDDAEWMPFAAVTIALGLVAMIRYATARVIAALWTAGFLMFLTQFEPWQVSSMHERAVTTADVQQFVAEPELDPRDSRLREYCATVASLRAAGIEIDPVDDWRRLARAVVTPLGMDSHALTRLARADLVPPAAWPEIAQDRTTAWNLRKLTGESGPLELKDYDSHLFAALAFGGATAEQRDHVVRRIERSWPAADDLGAMQRCRLLTEGLDRLGHPELADAHRGLVHALLVTHQQHSSHRRGGFAERPASGRHGPLPCDEIAFALIRRYGLPAELDLHALRGHLQRKSKLPSTDLETIRDAAFVAFAHLQYLDTLGPLPSRSLASLLIAERTFFAVLAMVLLCLYAVFRAPAKLRPTAAVLP